MYKIRSVNNPGAGGQDGEGDEAGHQHAGLGHRAPGLGHGRVAHEDVALNCQSWNIHDLSETWFGSLILKVAADAIQF